MGKILLTFLGILVNLEYVSSSEIYRSIYWVPENPLFSSGCSLELKVRQASTVQFVCPNPTTVLEERRTIIQPANMYENMWMVENKSMYDSCNATNGSSVFECNKPDNLHYASVVFNPFTADGGLPFKPGRTYYFLATSDGTQAHIKDRVGGRCSRKNGIAMKFEIYVCGSEDSTCDGKDIGTLQCKRNDQSATPSSSTPVATPTSSVTHCQSCATEAALKATAEGKTAGQGGQAGARNAADDHDAEIRKWRTIAIIALTIAAVPIVVSAFVIVIYKFIKRGKPSDLCSSDKSSNKIKHHSGEHYKNEALDYDFEDGSPVFDCQEGGFPNPDKKPNGVIENKTVVAVKSAPNGKTHTKQDPNCKTITDNARNMAVNSDSKVPQENPLTFAT